MIKWILISTLLLYGPPGIGQITDRSGTCKFELADQTTVTLVRGLQPESSRLYYYLPTNLRLSENKEHTPEFSFVTYKNDTETMVVGSLLHFLMYWGLTKKQESELNKRLLSLDSSAIIAGPVPLEINDHTQGFRIKGNAPISNLLRSKLTQQPIAPVLPETKIALSYKFNEEETKIVESALQNLHELSKDGIELTYQLRNSDSLQSIQFSHGTTATLWVSFKDLFSPVSLTKQRTK